MDYKIALPPEYVWQGSVNPTKVRVVERIDTPQTGGVEVWYKDCPFPFKGCLRPDIVQAVAIVKRYAMETARMVSRFPFLFLISKEQKANFVLFLEANLRPYYPKPQYLCKSAREVYKVLTQRYNENGILWFVIMVWEFDNAYRYMFQDIASETNKAIIRKEPRKEIIRLLDLAFERSVVSARIKVIKRIIQFTPKKYLMPIINFLSDIDIEQIKLDEGDKWFCANRPEYNFGGLSFEERKIRWRKN
jgi:hypothetical protein